MNYTITLTYQELINLAALLQDHIGLCHDLDYEVEASEYQATKDKIWSRLSGRPDPEEAPSRATWTRVDYEPCGHDYVCSKCGCKSDGPWKYCHDCGSPMQEVPTDD